MPPEDRPAATETLGGTHLFGGVVSKHFGHVLCGGTARLWGLDHSPCAVDGIVFFGRDPEMPNRLATRARGILGAFGIDLPVRIIDAPTRIERVVVAAQGFGVEDLLVGTPAYRRAMRTRAAAPDAVPAEARRLYVSRAKQSPRRGYTIGEAALQAALAAHGFEIVHPEDIGLAEQLALYRQAACIVASDGSALHVAGFAAPTGCHVVMLQRREGPTLDHIAESLGRFLGCPPDVIRADRQLDGAKAAHPVQLHLGRVLRGRPRAGAAARGPPGGGGGGRGAAAGQGSWAWCCGRGEGGDCGGDWVDGCLTEVWSM